MVFIKTLKLFFWGEGQIRVLMFESSSTSILKTNSTSSDSAFSPWPLWLTSLAVMTLLMTVCRKSLSPATLGEKREMFSCRSWRMASSNASLQYVHARTHRHGGKGWSKRAKTSSRDGGKRGGGIEGGGGGVIEIPRQTQSRLLVVDREAWWVRREKKTHTLKLSVKRLKALCSTGSGSQEGRGTCREA